VTDAPRLAAVTLICLASWWVIAAAHDPSKADGAWYKSLRSNRGEACCTAHQDCKTVSAYRQSLVSGDYEALWQGEWARIDPSAVLNQADNPTGLRVLCVYYPGRSSNRPLFYPTNGGLTLSELA
jgi:hypothetical protein